MPFFHEEKTCSLEWEIPRVENGDLPAKFHQTVLSSEQGACELCSEGLLGRDKDSLWWVRREQQNRPRTTGMLQSPSSFQKLAAAGSKCDALSDKYLQMA